MRTWIIRCAIILLSANAAFAQQAQDIDSLFSALNRAKEDTTRVSVLIKLSKAYQRLDLDSSQLLAREALQLSSKTGFIKGQADAKDKIATVYFFQGSYKESLNYFEEALELYASINHTLGVANLLIRKALVYESQRDFVTAKNYYDSALHIFKKMDDDIGIADTYMNLGILYYAQNKFKESLNYYYQSLKIFEELDDQSTIAMIQVNIGVIQKYLGNFDLAMDNLYKSLAYFENNKDLISTAQCLQNIAAIQWELNELPKAKSIFFKVLRSQQSLGLRENIAQVYHNLGVIYFDEENYDSAIYYLRKASEISKELNKRSGLAMNLQSMGSVYYELESYDSALYYLQSSLGLRKEIGDKRGMITSYADLGELHMRQKKYALAEKMFDEALVLIDQTSAADHADDVYLKVSELHKALGNYSQALSYYERHSQLKDSLVNAKKNNQILASEIRYETQKKEQEIALQDARIEKQQAIIKQRSLQRNLLFGGVFSLMVIAVLLIRDYRVKLKAKELVNRKHHEFVNLRSRFFANISHEFRTPLTLILGPLGDMLDSNAENREHKRNYLLMQQNAKKLLGLVNQLLDLAKLESRNLKLVVREGVITSTIQAIAASFTSHAQHRHIQFHIAVPSGVTGWYDEDKLEKIITNLFSNAFKFTPEGGEVNMKVSLVEEVTGEGSASSASSRRIKIVVEDTGEGIPPEQIDKIFDRFYQVDDSSTKEKSGTGIGLALVKELVELHRGEVSVDSYPGKGSTFTVFLPIAKEHFLKDEIADTYAREDIISHIKPEGMHSLTSAEDPAPNQKDLPHVLVVEDDKDVRDYIKRQLEQDYNVAEASNGEEGIAVAVGRIPDLIISDLMMPELDGIELCRRLKTDERTSHIPIVMLTAKASQNARIEGLETGADDYLVKPFDKRELQARVKNLIEQRRQLREKYSRQVTLQPGQIAITAADERFLEKVMKIIEDNIENSTFSVEEFSREIGMSRTQLFRKMQALTNQSVSEFVRDFRLKRAASLLEQRAGTVTEIAYQVGFNNLSYFAKCFKELFGKSPSEYLAAHT